MEGLENIHEKEIINVSNKEKQLIHHKILQKFKSIQESPILGESIKNNNERSKSSKRINSLFRRDFIIELE